MRILIYADPHLAQYSSIVRKRGIKYSQKLENVVNSISWAERFAVEQKCDRVICLGDFFDRPELNAEEITAVTDIQWNDLLHDFIVGNHESNVSSLDFSSTQVLDGLGFNIYDKVKIEEHDLFNICFIPYIPEDERQDIISYLPHNGKKNIIFSHNDIKGIRYGKFLSEDGFSIEEIKENSVLFINGHLHNGSFLDAEERVLNLGNLTGKNFGEDAFNFSHLICILDIDKLTGSFSLEFHENPYALNFYKLDIRSKKDMNILHTLKPNAVVSIKCPSHLVGEVKTFLEMVPNIVESRVISVFEAFSSGEVLDAPIMETVDHLKKFTEFIVDKLGNSEEVMSELQHIVGGN